MIAKRAGEDQRPPGSPQERDLEVLLGLARYRYLRTSQIEQLCFPSRRVANRRLGVLVEHGLVRRFRQLAVPGHGSNEFVYYLSAEGAAEAAAELGRESVAYPKPGDRGQGMKHLLGIIEVWLALDLACRRNGPEVVRFWPEWEGEMKGSRFVPFVADETPDLYDESRRNGLQPDAAFILGREGRQALHFLEVDRGTESIRGRKPDAFIEKFMNYASYRQHGGFKRYGENFQGFRVLTTWASEARMHNARAAAAEVGLRQMFLFTPLERVTPEAILEKIWLPPGEGRVIEPVGLV